MKVKIKRVDKGLPLPTYATKGSCCFDILSRQTMTIPAKQLALIPTNLIIAVPKGYMFIIASRSGTPKKKGLSIPHGFGIIDQDYNGPEDEIMFQVLNYTQKDVVVERGEKIAQGCFVPITKPVFVEVEGMRKKSRGGFGSTDKKTQNANLKSQK